MILLNPKKTCFTEILQLTYLLSTRLHGDIFNALSVQRECTPLPGRKFLITPELLQVSW